MGTSMQITPYTHQLDGAEQAFAILKQYGLVYLAWEERTGKSITSLLTAELTNRKNVLILTKKKALPGWEETLSTFATDRKYTVTNYHQACHLKAEYDLVILDEAHSYLSAGPKPGKIWKDVARLTKSLPLIYLSATPYAQGYQLLYNQFRLSTFSPWRAHRDFYRWFDVYGIPTKARTPYGLVETYSRVKDSAFATCSHLFMTKTRADINFEHEPEDVIHYVELSDETKNLYNSCVNKEVLRIGNIISPLDSSMKLRTTLHMIEGGVAKIGDVYHILSNREKLDAIRQDFGDHSNIAIMYNYIAEGNKLRDEFKHAMILQGTSFAEGVDLSGIEHLIIYSQDFSTARHSQRRARQANKMRATPIKVHFYLTKEGISSQVYETVSIKKVNFIDSLYERKELK